MPHPTQARTRLPDHTWQSHSSPEMAQVFVPKAQEFVLTRPEGFSLQTTDLQHVGSQKVDDYLDLFIKTNFESKVKMGKFISTLRPLDNATINSGVLLLPFQQEYHVTAYLVCEML